MKIYGAQENIINSNRSERSFQNYSPFCISQKQMSQTQEISDEQIVTRLKEQIQKIDNDLTHYKQKFDVQTKRLKYLKRENEQLKQKKFETVGNSQEIREQNSSLKQQSKLLKAQLKSLQTQLSHYHGNTTPKQAILKDTIINSLTEEVDLSKSSITDMDIDTIKSFSNIKTLIMGENQIGDQGMKTICLNLVNMKKLFLNHNLISDDGLGDISKLKSLRCLDLRCNKITDNGLEKIGQLHELSQLSLSNNGLTNYGVKFLVNLKQLKYLDITSNKISHEGAILLTQLNELTNLYLSHNQVTAQCVRQYLIQLKQLRVLDVRFNDVTKEQKEQIKTEKENDEKLSMLQLFL